MYKEVDLEYYLPDILKDIKDFKMIAVSENPEFRSIYEKIIVIINNCFVDTLNEQGCKKWESMLGLTIKETDSLATRKLRIKAAINGETPYTLRSVKNKLEIICGKDNFSVEYGSTPYTLDVSIGLGIKEQYDYIKGWLKDTVPANIVINLRLLYNTHETIKNKPLTHNAINQYAHRYLTEEVL